MKEMDKQIYGLDGRKMIDLEERGYKNEDVHKILVKSSKKKFNL
jgi:hypothetical protein